MPFDLADIDCITLSACGTAYYASMVGRYWFEEFARLPVEIDIASEFRYREPPLKKGGLAIFLTQSGETMDTLEALRYAKSCGQHIMSIVNVKESTIARESDVVLHTLAGPEIGVASTKAFTTQLAVLFALAVKLGLARGTLDAARAKHLLAAFREVPSRFAEAMNTEKHIFGIAHDFVDCADMVYLGRGTSCPIAMEGALKLKEVSYIHAEGYASGELKHGPIALVDEALPIVVIAPRDRWFEKTLSNMKEVHARGGPVLFISDKKGIEEAGEAARWTITMPEIDPALTPILYALPVQLIAYHTAVLKGTDVDQPRNLAKSVTVE